MIDIHEYLTQIFDSNLFKIVISKPKSKMELYKKFTIEKIDDFFQITKFNKVQAFHQNVSYKDIFKFCETLLVSQKYMQFNAWTGEKEYILLISKKGRVSLKVNPVQKDNAPVVVNSHNKKKNYILQEGQRIEPLIDMGVFTKDGKIASAMYDKFRQINRFIEIIDDTIKESHFTHLNIIDFGCGKSYLTFILYYYLTFIREIEVNMIGLDLKADVIEKCNATAKRYQYQNLRFEIGDIKGYQCPFKVDIVITLHACDIATDFALYNSILWKSKMIFSVPCCQHELNEQIRAQTLDLLTRYGIIKERFSALVTDAIRGNLLEYSGYKTQLLEFVDFSHTPKNILIRAVLSPDIAVHVKKRMLREVESMIQEFHLDPTLYRLLFHNGKVDKNAVV